MKKLAIKDIRLDGGTQPRAELDFAIVCEYADAMEEGASFPPITVFYDGSDYWCADGFHRIHASRQVGFEDIQADVRQGERRDAVLYSVGANSIHGMRRTNADKRRAVQTLLEDEEWAKWSDGKIAQSCGVSQAFVSSLRRASQNDFEMSTRLVERNGTVYEQRTENIGRRATITPEGELIVDALPDNPVDENDDMDETDECRETHNMEGGSVLPPFAQRGMSPPLSDPLSIPHHVDDRVPEDDESETMYLTKFNYKRLGRSERKAFINWLHLRGDLK